MNKKTLFKPVPVLSKRMFRSSRGRNLAAILAILLTTMMFAALFTLTQSMSRNLVEMTFRQTGYDAQASIRALTEQQADAIAAHPETAGLGRSIVLGTADLDALAGRQIEVRWADEEYAGHSFALPSTGRMPQEFPEIALDTLTLDRLGIPHEVGQPVILTWRKGSGTETVTQPFTLCGFWEGNESSYAGMAWVSRSYADAMTEGVLSADASQTFGLYMVQISLYSDRDIEGTMDRILADTGLSGLEYSVNLAYSPEMGAVAAQESLPMYFGMALVFAAGYLIIYNIFQISVTADVQFYGRLKTLGASSGQLHRLVYGQASRLCLIGIPAGLLMGWLLGSVLVPVWMGTEPGEASVSVSPVIFLGSALFSCLTVLISCLHPARLAGKVSPIEAMRMSDADTDPRKVRRSGMLTRAGRHPQIPSLASMAWANLWRSRKRTLTVICSLSLGLVLLSCFYAKNAAFDMEKYLKDLTLADFELSDITSEDYYDGYDPHGTTLNDALVQTLESMEGLEQTGHLYSHQTRWQMDPGTRENLQAFYTQDMLDDWATYDAAGVEAFHRAVDSGELSVVILGLDGIPLHAITQERYLMDGSFDSEAFAGGDYVLAVGPAVDPDADDPVLPAPSVGSTIRLEGRDYTVMAVVYPLTPVDSGAAESGSSGDMQLHFILPADVFRSCWPDNTLRKLFLNVDDAHLDAAQDFLEEYRASSDPGLPVTSRLSMAQQYEPETRSGAVKGNAVSIVIALVGVLSFFKSMAKAIVSRRREFAVIQSIGMTRKQLRRMLICEGLFYAFLTLAASFLISSFAVGVVIRAMVAGGFTTFRFTLLPLAVCAPLILVFAVLIPCICFRNLDRHSIVERLRME